MHNLGLIRRVAIAVGAFALLAAVACQNALAQSGRQIRNIEVDVAPLRANSATQLPRGCSGKLPDQLAKALAGRMRPQGGTLVVRIDYALWGRSRTPRPGQYQRGPR